MSYKISSHCFLAPLDEDQAPDEKLLANEKSLQIYDTVTERSTEYHFEHVYRSPSEFTKSCYNNCIAPLIKETIRGESTVAVCGGPEALNIRQYLLSQTSMQGIINQAAGQLLNSVNTEYDKVGSVTFSWFRIDCGSPEVLTDVLKSASTSQGVIPAGKSGDANSLMLRELGRGRGMVVPGLWEVEITSGADIEAVVDHVLRMIPHVADHQTGNSHTVMQLTVTNHAVAEEYQQQQYGNGSSAASLGGRSTSPLRSSASLAGSGVADGPGVGRVSFVLLSDLDGPQLNQFEESMDVSSLPMARYNWVDQAKIIMQWLESRRASPPFAKSRLLLLLKDILMQRQRAAFLLMISPNDLDHDKNLEWVRLVGRFCKDHMSSVRDAKHELPSHTGTIKPNDSTKRSSSAGPRIRTSTPQSRPPPGSFSNSTRSVSRGSTPVRTRGSTPLAASSTAPASIKNIDTSGSLSAATTPRSAPAGVNELNLERAQRRSALKRANSNSNVSISRNDRCSSPGREASLVRAADEGDSEVVDPAVIARFEETELALQMALEASRSECAALKSACNYANDKYQEVKSQFDGIVQQLEEEGPTLVKRDRERLRSALKDLKDYEIYKEVMEAAMTRMQQELEVLAQENQDIKAHRAYEEKQVKKQKNFSEKYTKDLVATKRKLASAEERIVQLEKQLKQSSRDRDVAVSTLAQTKAKLAMKEGQSQVHNEQRSLELKDLEIKLQKMERKCRELQTDKDAMLASNESETASLRAAHSKALEMLMGYQEENDALRSMLNEAGIDTKRISSTSSKYSKKSAIGRRSSTGTSDDAVALAAAGMLSRTKNTNGVNSKYKSSALDNNDIGSEAHSSQSDSATTDKMEKGRNVSFATSTGDPVTPPPAPPREEPIVHDSPRVTDNEET